MNVEKSPKTALVTGATGKIGEAIVRGLVRAGFDVTIVARDRSRGERVADALKCRVEICDLSRHQEIRALSERWEGALDVLVNDAAECPRQRQETPEGIERQLASNVLAYLWMMEAFEPYLASAPSARVVNVASYWAGGLDIDDLEFKRRRYDNDAAYRQSKQADRMLSAAFAEKFRAKGIAVNACHPGDVRSKLSSDLGFGGHESPDQGADTPLWSAVSPELEGVTGKYFAHRREEPCRFSSNNAAVNRLMEALSRY